VDMNFSPSTYIQCFDINIYILALREISVHRKYSCPKKILKMVPTKPSVQRSTEDTAVDYSVQNRAGRSFLRLKIFYQRQNRDFI